MRQLTCDPIQAQRCHWVSQVLCHASGHETVVLCIILNTCDCACHESKSNSNWIKLNQQTRGLGPGAPWLKFEAQVPECASWLMFHLLAPCKPCNKTNSDGKSDNIILCKCNTFVSFLQNFGINFKKRANMVHRGQNVPKTFLKEKLKTKFKHSSTPLNLLC